MEEFTIRELTEDDLPKENMELKEAKEIYEFLKCSKNKKQFNNLIKYAIIYARIRVDWALSTMQEQIDANEERTIAHDEFILSFDLLTLKMKECGENFSWRYMIGSDRKAIGDFACLLQAVIGIEAR
jgi:hypothetical protein